MSGKGDSPRRPDPAHVLRCEDVGHAFPDIRGRCTRCTAYLFGAPLTFPPVPTPTPEDSDG